MLLENLSWQDVEVYLKTKQEIVIVLGATEEHSDLSLCTDTLIPFYIAQKACERSKTILLPPLNYGISAWSREYPGTVSLKTVTYMHVISDIFDSLIYSGFKKFFILNGHGFNRAVCPLIIEKLHDVENGEAIFTQWYELNALKKIAREINCNPSHANWAENFSFTNINRNHKKVNLNKIIPNFLQQTKNIRKIMKEGHGTGKLQINPNLSNVLLQELIEEYYLLLQSK